MTNRAAIQRIIDGFQAYSNDSSLSKRYIYNLLRSARSELLKQEAEKKRLWNSFTTQAINCFKLIPVDISECCDYETGCLILKSIIPLPKLIDTIFGKIITGMYDISGNDIDKTTLKDWNLVRKRKYRLASKAKWFIKNDYLYVVDINDIEDIEEFPVVPEGIFEDPSAVERLNYCDELNSCTVSALDYEFNCPGYLERRIFAITAQEVARKLGIPRDDENNAREDINPARVQQQNNQVQQQQN